MARLNLSGIHVDVVFKDIKNVHLSVYPQTGRVRIAAPKRMKLDTVRVFAISKLGWIKTAAEETSGSERETPREYVEREPLRLGQRHPANGFRKDEGSTYRVEGQSDASSGASW